MHLTKQRLLALATGVLWAAVSSIAIADDTELFVGSGTPTNRAPPNILLILDDSGSMDAKITTQNRYNPATEYTGGGCNRARVYWSTSGTPPTCGSTVQSWFNRSALKCRAALDAFGGLSGGTYRDFLAGYDDVAKLWAPLSESEHDRTIECAQDWGKFGDEPPQSGAVYARNGDSANLWTSGDADWVQWGSHPVNNTYWIYDGNWLAWYYSPGTETTRLQVIKDVATNLVSTVNGVNIGLMHFTQITGTGSDGGTVFHAVESVSTGRATLRDSITGLTQVSNRGTPLSETLLEATQYMMGGNVKYGLQAPQSVPASRRTADQTKYESPILYSCQKNYIVYLTDGEPSDDYDADTDILALTDLSDGGGKTFKNLVGNACDMDDYPPGTKPEGGVCLDDLAQFLHDGDLSPKPGLQNVITHTVGFALGSIQLPVLQETADRGGGHYYEAANTASLTTAFSDIIAGVLDTQATFTSPAVSVNSFNRTQNLNDLYVSLFEPSTTRHWPGNLKKYKLRPSDGVIVDANGQPAINSATGQMFPTTRSFWTPTSEPADGANVELGGAAHRIPTARKVYTYLGTNSSLTDTSNAVDTGNGAITDALLKTDVADQPTREQVIAFINGQDAADIDHDGDKTEPRFQMGDPLHSQALSMVYGPTVDDAIVFFATNDGYLHAIDATTGVEKWAFVPREFLGKQAGLLLDSASALKNYGVDGSLRIQAIGDNDGVVEKDAGERVYLFFGMRGGGDAIYALDVTDPVNPAVLWRKDHAALSGLGQTWSSAVPTKINVAGATQNANKLAVVLGGGYDARQDGDPAVNNPVHPAAQGATDFYGASIYILDSVTGATLWHGAKSGGDHDFDTENKSMDYSIPADVKVVDLDGDDFVDRMYAADMGGQVWRFDVHNRETATDLITGGVIAQLGGGPNDADTPLADVRRFYYSPDVAIATDKQTHTQFVHVGIGSGHRAHPRSLDNHDRFYAIRDKHLPLGSMTQDEFDAIEPITDDALTSVLSANTSMTENSVGWKFVLNAAAGEKVMAESRTFNNAVLFTTYTPNGATPPSDPCTPALGANRLYVMNIFNGAPVTNLDGSTGSGPLTFSDISRVTGGGSISPGVTFLFPSKEGTDPNSPDRPAPVACVDFFCLPASVLTGGNFGRAPVRTFWNQASLD